MTKIYDFTLNLNAFFSEFFNIELPLTSSQPTLQGKGDQSLY